MRLLWWALIQYDLHFDIREKYQAEKKHTKTTLYDSKSQNWSNLVAKLGPLKLHKLPEALGTRDGFSLKVLKDTGSSEALSWTSSLHTNKE